jgi:hypothetical protein
MKYIGPPDQEKHLQLPDAPGSIVCRRMISLSVFCEDISKYLRNERNDLLKIYIGERYESSC